MSRYDKYDPYDGGFRAPLLAAIAADDRLKAYAVGLDSSGRVVLGAGQTGIVGVLIAHDAMKAGDIVDVMTDGEIVDFTLTAGTAAAAGTVHWGDPSDGSIVATSASGANTQLGFTVEATRLVVRVHPVDLTA